MYRKPFKIPADRREEIIRAAISVADYVEVDQLDCSVSFSRQETDKTVDEVIAMGLADKKTLWHFIHRPAIMGEQAYYDIGLSTMRTQKPDYFLWVRVKLIDGDKLIDKFNLQDT